MPTTDETPENDETRVDPEPRANGTFATYSS